MHPFRRVPSSITPDVLVHRLDRLASQWLRPTSSSVSQDVTEAIEVAGPDADEHRREPRRLLLPDRASLRAVLLIAVLAAVVVGWMWWQGRPRPVVPAPQVVAEGSALASGAASAGEVVVHVTGAVTSPGLVRLPAGSRVDDAIHAAGGAKNPKALGSVNLARVLVDGEQILVGGSPGQSAAGPVDDGINLNQASASDLEDLPGVGPVLAQRIVDWRTANGPFRSVDELGEVSGIGDSLLSQIRTLARV